MAQSGKGLSWSDKADRDNGGNCYNCHQITKEEISFGTIGPSLYNYGKLRGVTDPNSPAGMEIVKYTWGKMWNARATNACSLMPRFGHNDILDEAADQGRDGLVAGSCFACEQVMSLSPVPKPGFVHAQAGREALAVAGSKKFGANISNQLIRNVYELQSS